MHNSFKIPADVDLVVGIPRSGMLAASLIALNRNLRLLDIEGFLSRRLPRTGRTASATVAAAEAPVRHVLIVDDSIASGRSMRAVRREVEQRGCDERITFLAVYGAKAVHEEVEITLEQVPTPRLFGWNLLRHNRLMDSCVAIEGVLFRDSVGWTETSLLKPIVQIPHLIGRGREHDRSAIEHELRAHGIDYGRLWLFDDSADDQQPSSESYARFKSSVYTQSKCCLFVDGDDLAAASVAQLSRRPVLSIGGQRIIWPEDDDQAKSRYRHSLFLKDKRGSRGYPWALLQYGLNRLHATRRKAGA